MTFAFIEETFPDWRGFELVPTKVEDPVEAEGVSFHLPEPLSFENLWRMFRKRARFSLIVFIVAWKLLELLKSFTTFLISAMEEISFENSWSV